MLEKYWGMSDMPMSEENEDCLDTRKYVNGLVKFVKECSTPMSIALQGDWGTGKTSFIMRMINKINEKNKIECKANQILYIYFNTWQYSQFNMSDSLYYSLMQCIINCIMKNYDEHKEDAEKILNNTWNMLKNIFKQLIRNEYGVDVDDVFENTSKYGYDSIENIKTIKEDYEKLITKITGDKGRVIIFVDDLDRLNPNIAVELLETIKLFMDVKKCVFVFAIDYEVVVRGIKAKYGNDMDEIKCRSFFDKIIQVPFRMPTEKYKIEKMMERENLKKQFGDYTDVLGTLIKNTVGPNPRAFKRIINVYELLRIIEQKDNDQYDATLLFINLILQMYAYDSYMSFRDFFKLEEGFNISDYESFINNNEDIDPVFKALDSVKDKSSKDIKTVITDLGKKWTLHLILYL